MRTTTMPSNIPAVIVFSRSRRRNRLSMVCCLSLYVLLGFLLSASSTEAAAATTRTRRRPFLSSFVVSVATGSAASPKTTSHVSTPWSRSSSRHHQGRPSSTGLFFVPTSHEQYQQQKLVQRQHPNYARKRHGIKYSHLSFFQLFGISEWRDTNFRYPGTGDDRRIGKEQGAPPKEICILPFHFTEVLLQGETKQLRLYEDRFLQLFDYAQEHHGGVVAMGLLAPAMSGMIQIVPLCELEAYNRITLGGGSSSGTKSSSSSVSIFVTIRVVGRARLLEVLQQEPYMKAVCMELTDTLPPNLELPNLVASNIETNMVLLSSMEHRLAQQLKLLQQKNTTTTNKKDTDAAARSEQERSSSSSSNNNNTNKTTDALWQRDADRQRRIQLAKLEGRYYRSSSLNTDDDDEDDEDEEEEDVELDRRARFRQAYDTALMFDTQGYCTVSDTTNSIADRTPAELTALSWAAFCTEPLPEDELEAVTYRIQALDADHLLDRLKLANHMLRNKQVTLQQQLQQAGIPWRSKNSNNYDDKDDENNDKKKKDS